MRTKTMNMMLSSCVLFVVIQASQSQISPIYDNDNRNNQDPYNRDRNTDPYNRDRDRDRDRDRNVDPYGNRDRDRVDPYGNNRDRDPYNRSNDPYQRNNQYNDPYNRNNNQTRPYDPNDPYNRANDPYNQHNRTYDRYNNQDRYDPNRDRDPYNRDNINRDRDRDPYNRDNSNRDRDRDRDPYNRDRDPYNRDRDRDPYNRDNRYGGTGGTGGSNYGGNFGTSTGNRYGADDGTCCEEYCYSVDEQPYVKFGAKTPYQFAYGKISNQHIVPQCKPIQFWSVVREGTSLPDRMSIERYKQMQKIHDEIIRNYEEKRSFPDKGRLCAEDYDILKRWRWNDTISEHNAGMLTQQGSDDLKFLARRYQTRLRDLLLPYNENHYFFQYTEGDRSSESYRAYVDGLFGSDSQRVHASVLTNRNTYNSQSGYGSQYGGSSNRYDNNQYGSQSSSSYGSNSYSSSGSYSSSNSYGSQNQYGSNMYSPDSACKSYEQRMDEDHATAHEYQMFKQKPEYKEMVRNVFRRLGFRYTPNDSLVEDMYDLCRYEKSWYVTRPSPWCAVFTQPQLKLLEYADDLFNFYKSGYGHEYLNKNLGCSLVKDMYDRFERTINGNTNEPKAIFHFRDMDTILKMLVGMGIGKDPQMLTSENYYQLTRRQWRIADLTPFSGNLAAILYQCEGYSQTDKYKVMFFINENPVDYPACSVGLCTWDAVKDKLQYLTNDCRADWCERGAADSLTSRMFVLIGALLIFKIFS